jgi:hypothetical protein
MRKFRFPSKWEGSDPWLMLATAITMQAYVDLNQCVKLAKEIHRTGGSDQTLITKFKHHQPQTAVLFFYSSMWRRLNEASFKYGFGEMPTNVAKKTPLVQETIEFIQKKEAMKFENRGSYSKCVS